MTKLKSPVKEALKFRQKGYIDLKSHWTLQSCVWGRPEKSLGTSVEEYFTRSAEF